MGLMVSLTRRLQDGAKLPPTMIRLEDKRCYALIESYCENPKCDCRTVHIGVYDCTPFGEWKDDAEVLAEFRYEWCKDCETLGGCDHYKVSVYEKESPTDFDLVIMEAFEAKIKTDPVYCHYINEDYHLVKEYAAKKKVEKRKDQNVGRNAPCPCGSGKKYKKCCLLKT